MKTCYANFQQGSALYNLESHTFTLSWSGMGDFIRNAGVTEILVDNSVSVDLSAFGKVHAVSEIVENGTKLTVSYTKGPECCNEFEMAFLLSSKCIRLSISIGALVKAQAYWGKEMEEATFACRLDRNSGDLRAGLGPAVSKIDNALFDRLSDSALEICGSRSLRLSYLWDQGCYGAAIETDGGELTDAIDFKIHQDYMQRKFHIPYSPINKNTQFPTPPVGWMTWYALKFETSERNVLENARFMAEHLKPYGANCMWVDWEWLHSCNPSVDEHPDIDTFSPDPRRYPSGLAYVADEIKSLGLIPAFWVGATNDPNKNRMLKEHPEWILTEYASWCGRWWIDPSHPEILSDYIPAVFRQVLEWGFEAIKWDAMPISLKVYDRNHSSFHDPEISSDQALRNVIKTAREIIGPDRYMMSCSGQEFRDITLGIDFFDGGRIGQDIFAWDDYIQEAVGQIHLYYYLHNIAFYADLDNVVIREEFNSIEQARSRVSFNALTGTPVTFGDHLPDLPPERLDLLKRMIPAMDFHPMDLNPHAKDLSVVTLNTVIARPFETWNVIDIFNTEAETKKVRLDLADDLHLDTDGGQRYLLFDYWTRSFVGTHDKAIEFEIEPYASRVLAVRLALDRPQILSTSRHITQGGPDLLDVCWDGDSLALGGKSEVVAGEDYLLYIFAPRPFQPSLAEAAVDSSIEPIGDCVWAIRLRPEFGGGVEWKVVFACD